MEQEYWEKGESMENVMEHFITILDLRFSQQKNISLLGSNAIYIIILWEVIS
jgi:hypothetical protein